MKNNIVRFNFLALDTHDKEVFSLDYAIVLDLPDENKQVRILPITNMFNQESMESFCIGKVDGFIEVKNEGFVQNNQYVRFDKILKVDKDRLHPVFKQDLYGRLIRDEDSKLIPVIISDDIADRVSKKLSLYEDGDDLNPYKVISRAESDFSIDFEANKDNPLNKLAFEKVDKYKEYNFDQEKILIFFINGERFSVRMVLGQAKDLNERNKEILDYYQLNQAI